MSYSKTGKAPACARQTERNPLANLLAMLTTMRPEGSKTERAFCKQWLAPLGAKPDAAGNWILDLPCHDGADSRVMWSSHTDTVHRVEGHQKINLTNGVITLSPESIAAGASCLGADCTTGVWLMREMAMARVPGLYIWHAAEEVGGRGSAAIARNPTKLQGLDYAIAFDRKGFDSVITYQAGGRCCSDLFAASIGEQLPGTWAPDDGGLFTDTANYTDIIGECTNISVGYGAQHTPGEWQDAPFALALRDALLAFDESRLTGEREPGEVEEFEHGAWLDVVAARVDSPGAWNGGRPRSVLDFVKDYPEEAADLLESLGIGLADCLDTL